MPSTLKIFEAIPKRTPKWILFEPYARYENNDYLLKLIKLDLLPLGYKFLFTDLSFFHRVIHGNIITRLPSYLSLTIPSPNVLDKLRTRAHVYPSDEHPIFQCCLNSPKINHSSNDPLLFRSNLNPRTQVNETTYFNRSHIEWNKLPLAIRIQESLEKFQDMLRCHIWELLREQLGLSEWPD